ncbi:MAG: ribosome maturation factor RimM [Acidobacteriota bacterium]
MLVGRILRAHGIRGEVKVEPWSDVQGRFDRGVSLRVLAKDGGERRRVIERVRGEKGTLLVKLVGVDDRDQADRLNGARLAVDSAEVPDPPEGFYYHFQLVGCDVHDATIGSLGQVVEVIEDGGGILLRVVRDQRSLLVPFVDAFLGEIDIGAARIDVALPDGLIEACTA